MTACFSQVSRGRPAVPCKTVGSGPREAVFSAALVGDHLVMLCARLGSRNSFIEFNNKSFL